ncbi:MAG: TetR family transcriptional regulator [Anaerolineales bacterium]|nr:TetR family transcriptional regulator [Anaerolineales bacterium]MBX3036209.1 TetR family transcriptional regulator [Anaerolineales bacterium]
MPPQKQTKRKYDSSRRKAQAFETHQQILEAADRLFTINGYSGTSIEAIAQKASVAPETIYVTFKNKKTILSMLIKTSILGDDDNPVPVMLREQIREVAEEKNQKRQIQMFAKRIHLLMSRVAQLLEVMKSASKTEPEIKRLSKKYADGRFHGMGFFIDCVMANGVLRNKLDKLTATETVWLLTSAEVYNLLIVERGWSGEEYEVWLSQTLTDFLLP